jgi:transposase
MRLSLEQIDVNMQELETLLERTRQGRLEEADYQKLRAAIHTLGYVADLLRERNISLADLRELLLSPPPASTEKTREVLKNAGLETEEQKNQDASSLTSEKPSRPGHGRHAAIAYSGATQVRIAHATLHAGDRCPECGKGKVYALETPGVLIRLVGQAPIAGTIYELEKLRCNLCLEVFTAEAPAGVGEEKYDATSASMMALLKYGSGMPFHRLEVLQEQLEIPLPASTQWGILKETAERIEPALEELIRQAAQGQVLYNDDTGMRVLGLDTPDPPERKGVFTSGIISTREGQRIALFFTGRRHAGENLAAVLARRAAELGPPIQMCDALSRNLPKSLEVILGHCLAHGRRRFVKVIQNFPQECRHVLEALAEIYHNDELTREHSMSAEERLRFHQTHSRPVMDQLHVWLTTQFAEKRVEPNSGLGQAIAYLLNHWRELTLFLRQPAAPLDNNICERGLKKVILHRKNAFFYKSQNGADVGDLFMSLIHTCELSGANAFDYLTALQRNAAELANNAGKWMPWNFSDTLAQLDTVA